MTRPVVRLDLLPKQRAFCEATEDEVLYSGAWGAGKSRALGTKAFALAQLYPGTTIGLCRKTLADLKATTLKTLLREVIPPAHVVGHHKADRVITVPAGPHGEGRSEIYYFGLDDETRIGSLNLGACGVDEAIELTQDEWEALGGRLREPHCGLHQLFGATNPAGKGHFLYQRFFQHPTPGVHAVIKTKATDNSFLPPAYLARIQRLTGRYYARYVAGEWVDFEGLVYDAFDPTVHLLTWDAFAERFGTREIPATWPRVLGIDFGYANPFVCQWWAISPDGEWFRYRELYHTRRLVEAHARDIVRRSGHQAHLNDTPWGERITAIYADHDAEDRATLEAHGVPTQMADKAISVGIEAVYRLMEPDAVTGRPGLWLLRDARVEEDPALVDAGEPTSTEEELGLYAYPKGTTAKNPKEVPVDKYNHGADAMRYAVYTHLAKGFPGRLKDLATLGPERTVTRESAW